MLSYWDTPILFGCCNVDLNGLFMSFFDVGGVLTEELPSGPDFDESLVVQVDDLNRTCSGQGFLGPNKGVFGDIERELGSE